MELRWNFFECTTFHYCLVNYIFRSIRYNYGIFLSSDLWSDIDIFYLGFYIWSNKRLQSCYTLIFSKEQLLLLSINGAICIACDAD